MRAVKEGVEKPIVGILQSFSESLADAVGGSMTDATTRILKEKIETCTSMECKQTAIRLVSGVVDERIKALERKVQKVAHAKIDGVNLLDKMPRQDKDKLKRQLDVIITIFGSRVQKAAEGFLVAQSSFMLLQMDREYTSDLDTYSMLQVDARDTAASTCALA